MAARESLQEVENLRFRFQMNNRLRLEFLAAVSKVFRELGEPISDRLLSAIVFALPEELMSSNVGGFATMEQAAALPPEAPGKPMQPEKPGLPPEKPGQPDQPDKPKEKPAQLPPESPAALPPESPAQPALPPEQPSQVASEYVA